MHVLHVRDVNEALPLALAYLRDRGQPERTRNGPALVAPGPVATVYQMPQRRVLFDPERDANPFFHLFESLWILAGRRDVKFLSWFNSRIANYSDDGNIFHAAYGYRLRRDFNGTDQIQVACDMLRKDPFSRRVVLQIWSAASDLDIHSKDLPCNCTVMLRVRAAPALAGHVLDITVCNRSNDAIWGTYGANAVQFSFIQEYMANKIGVGVGEYTQMSHNLHVYTENPYWQGWLYGNERGVHVRNCEYEPSILDSAVARISPLDNSNDFDADLSMFFQAVDEESTLSGLAEILSESLDLFQSPFFTAMALPMLFKFVHRERKIDGFNEKFDWHYAGARWLERRSANKPETS